MDLIAACKAFVTVSEYGTFTVGAAAARMPQSVASRRIAALEARLGGRLFDRSSRRVTLTPFGRDMLPSARRLVELAEAMEHAAERARLRPFGLAVPAVCNARALALLVAAGRRQDLHLEVRPAGPGERVELCRSLEVRAALVMVPPGNGAWQVPLGLAGREDPGVAAVHLEALRGSWADRDAPRRRVWIQPEDDVPEVRDRVVRLGESVGLQPEQVSVAPSVVVAAAEVFGSEHLLLCARNQAVELGLHWRPVGEACLGRSYDVVTALGDDAERLRTDLSAEIGHCLGAPQDGGGDA